ncbi:ZYRO0F02376p [Zygosaccharomyces rouxii]|uniref:ZYRO0F02376p n=1 Tax=Zygosaccharomyces rouxii (strain ATCC 2623 / CBS 732 / NBRC 1130 / NCYC 568 / NRRL Y-229) TaxID=559307 RepID=C5DX56_ZYGRC|nr:uncharacterized protein ZYRO0F02376g [Zygosaccharomyces rouxii]KAH9199130.1 regulator of chromosome condensation 1/beta-lactamase-inhibitor protein II [Zygosaccharomyces rouxii]CAR28367.1 ZYRO0F02376p [Zygosaccharomyces rouxii]
MMLRRSLLGCGNRLTLRIPSLRNFSSCTRLYKNSEQIDEAELWAPNLTSQPYKAKKSSKEEFQWPDQSEEQAQRAHEIRVEKLMRLSAVFQGLLILLGVGAATTTYMKWPQIKSWWVTKDDYKVDDNTIERLVKSKTKKSMDEIAVISDANFGPEVSGLYLAGSNEIAGKNKAGYILPKRIPLFDHKVLRDVCLSDEPNGKENLAIDERGDLLKWSQDAISTILPDQNLVKVKLSNNVAYALNKKGEILVIPVKDPSSLTKHVEHKRSWVLPWKTYCSYDWKLDTKDSFKAKGENKIIQFDTGKHHLALVSNKGNAYSCATGIKSKPQDRSHSYGQFGVPTLSQFDEFPPCNKLYEIELLNRALDSNNSVYKRDILQVACGDYHTLARDAEGKLFGFGINKNGQLGLPISYDNEQIPFPKIISRFGSYFGRDSKFKCVDINCSTQTSFVTLETSDDNGKKDVFYFSFGDGLNGELGNGNYKNCQPEPAPIKSIDSPVKEWSCGGHHIWCKLADGQVLVWGFNERGQLGTGKRIKVNRPQPIPGLLKPGDQLQPDQLYRTKLFLQPQQSVAAGETSTCIYWKK